MKSQKEEEGQSQKLRGESIRALSVFYPYFRPYLWIFALGMICLILSTATSLVFPYAIGKILDAALQLEGQAFVDAINKLALFLAGILGLQALFSFLRIITFTYVSEHSLSSIRKALFAKLVDMPMNFFHQQSVGELTSRISTDLSLLSDTFVLTLPELLRGIFNLIIGIGIIFWISTPLTLLMIATFPIMIIGAIIFGKYIKKLSKSIQQELAQSQSIAQEVFVSILNVKVFTNENYEKNRFNQSLEKAVQMGLKASWYRALFASFIIFCLFGAIILIIGYGAYLVYKHEITVGQLTQFVIYTVFVGAALGSFSEYYAQIQKTLGATERIRELMNEPIEISAATSDTTKLPDFKKDIVFKNVTFSYPSRTDVTVLRNLSLILEGGKTTAFVGPSGAGKSTITQLLLNLYASSQGSILIDNVPIETIPLKSLRKHIALVPQDVLLFGGTIRENILYGNLEATEAELIEASRQAYAHEFIMQFPQGYDTLVGERGVQLSGGQRQRIAIARAILKNPDILILDEATSALDADSEQLVQHALNNLMKNRTTLIIAHRLATIKNSEKILVLQNGELVEQGTHEELMHLPNGIYANLANLQFHKEHAENRSFTT